MFGMHKSIFPEVKETYTQEEYVKMKDDLFRPVQKIGMWGWLWMGFLALIVFAGVYAYFLQETQSKYVTINLRDYTMWGVYICNFVFFVALSIIGVLMSAILKFTHFEWYRPLSRIAEIIALAAIMLAGLSIVVAMGRPDRLFILFTHGRIQSPIVWDVIVVITYVLASILFVWLPLIPSIATSKYHLTNKPKWQMKFYDLLSFGWVGSPEQWKLLKRMIRILTIMFIPLGIAIQTIDAWLFATTLRAEWDSTNFSAYFVSGAFLLSTAAMIVAVAVFRKVYHLEKYLTERHFNYLGKMLVLMAAIYAFFNINEYMVPAYKMSGLHANHLLDLFTGEESLMYWSVAFFAILMPATFPLFNKMRKPLPLTIIAVIVVIASWFKRYLIVIPGLLHPYLPIQNVPASWQHYTPSLVEMTIIAATFAALLLIVTIFSRLFPIISVWEVAEGRIKSPNADEDEND